MTKNFLYGFESENVNPTCRQFKCNNYTKSVNNYGVANHTGKILNKLKIEWL